jgi:hypothetical protein
MGELHQKYGSFGRKPMWPNSVGILGLGVMGLLRLFLISKR